MFDAIFGELEHKYNLYKYETINLFGNNNKVKIVVELNDNDTVLKVQQKNYQHYLQYIDEHKEQIINSIKQYFLNVYGKNINIYKDIIPITVYFSRVNGWGILFDTELDEENGFAFFVEDGKISVGTQDMFI